MTDGELVPNVGDKAEMFFKLDGVEGDVSVATGSVVKIESDSVQVKIETATGEVAKDQLVRITSENPRKRTAAPAAVAKTDESNPMASIIGAWNANDPNGGKIGFEFKEDSTFVWTFLKDKQLATVRGRYRLDQSTNPNRIEFFETDKALAGNVNRLLGLFELQTGSRLKLDFSPSLQQNRDKGFTEGAIVFTKGPLIEGGLETAMTSPSAASSPAPPAPAPVSPPSSTAPPRRGKLVLDDRFDNPKDTLLIEGNKNVNGEREIIANPGSRRNRGYNNAPRDFYAEASVRATKSEGDCRAGFSFRALNDDGGTMVTYESILFAPGSVAFGSTQNAQGAWDVRALPAGTYADATQNTRIGLEAIGREYRVFVEGNCVISFTGAEPSKGRDFSLILWNEGQTPCTAYFDNLKIYSASTAAEKSGEKKSKPRKR